MLEFDRQAFAIDWLQKATTFRVVHLKTSTDDRIALFLIDNFCHLCSRRFAYFAGLEFQTVDVFNVCCLSRAKECDDDGEANRDLSRPDGDDEEDKNLRVVIRNSTGLEVKSREGDER